VLQKEDNGWMKECMEYEVEGARYTKENLERECGKWMIDDHNRCEWV